MHRGGVGRKHRKHFFIGAIVAARQNQRRRRSVREQPLHDSTLVRAFWSDLQDLLAFDDFHWPIDHGSRERDPELSRLGLAESSDSLAIVLRDSCGLLLNERPWRLVDELLHDLPRVWQPSGVGQVQRRFSVGPILCTTPRAVLGPDDNREGPDEH